jgi:phosphoserine phosphatase RsbU/P
VTRRVAVILPESGAMPGDLLAALAEAGLHTVRLHPADVAPGDRDLAAVLVPASLGPAAAFRVGRRLAAGPGFEASVLVYPERDLAALEACAKAGLDYVAPPFLPGLLQVRLEARRRASLTRMTRQAERDRELDEARRVQTAFLPDHPPTVTGWQVSAIFRPARQVSGDFYDWFPLGDGRRLGFVIADVCDKGYGAALLMTPLRTLIRHVAAGGDPHADAAPGPESFRLRAVLDATVAMSPLDTAPLRAAIDAANRYLVRDHQGQGRFATVFIAMLDPASGHVWYVNAGHHPPVLLRSDGTQESLRATGPAVGMFDGVRYALAVDHLSPGDSLFAYTDGLVEARSAGGISYGRQRALAAAGIAARSSAEGLLEGVEVDLERYLGPLTPQDDLTMLAVRRLPMPL